MSSTITLRDADRILPLYLICDTSLTMSVSRNGGRRPIDVLNESIDNIFQVIDKRPPTTVDIHVSVISFNTRASLSREMAAIDSGATMLPLTSSGVTNLAPALDLFKSRLVIDKKNRGPRGAYRPVAFIMTDGVPTDYPEQWVPIVRALGEMPFPPRLIPCALGKSVPDVFAQLTAAYGTNVGALTNEILSDGKDVAERIASLFEKISRTLDAAQAPTTQEEMDATVVAALTEDRNKAEFSFFRSLYGNYS